jgi:hypothetical protein
MPTPHDAVRVPETSCPHCGHRLDAVSMVGRPTPQPTNGDFTVCIGCGEVLQFDFELNLTRVSPMEIALLDGSEARDLQLTQRIVRRFIDQRT